MLELLKDRFVRGLIVVAVACAVAGEASTVYRTILQVRVECQAALNAPELKKTEADKMAAEAKVATLQQALTQEQTAKTAAEAKVQELSAALTVAQTSKTNAEAEVQRLTEALTSAQTRKTEAEAKSEGAISDIITGCSQGAPEQRVSCLMKAETPAGVTVSEGGETG